MSEVSVFAIDWRSLLVPKLPLIDVVMRTICIYIILQLGLRFLGRKNLQHSASYNMVTLFLVGAFGGRAVLGEDTSMTACALGLVVVLLLNAMTTYAVFHSRHFATFFEGPAVRQLVKDGVVQEEMMHETKCSREMLAAELRGKGKMDIAAVQHAFMERTGDITFIFKPDA